MDWHNVGVSILNEQQQAYLANPFYAALTTLQTDFAEHTGNAVRYRPNVLPFSSVAREGDVVDIELLRRDGDVNFACTIPTLDAEVADSRLFNCLQMVWQPRDITVPDALENESELGPDDADDMVELTQIAFPGYYRHESYQLGRYIGLRVNGQLVAMAGHRTRMPGLREISAVCTRPGFTSKGYAQHLVARLLNQTDELPYLHVVSTNARAIPIYEALGFVTTAEVPILYVPQSEASQD